MQGEVKIINIMADGSICDDLATYFSTHELPDLAKRLIYEFIQEGYALSQKNDSLAAAQTANEGAPVD